MYLDVTNAGATREALERVRANRAHKFPYDYSPGTLFRPDPNKLEWAYMSCVRPEMVTLPIDLLSDKGAYQGVLWSEHLPGFAMLRARCTARCTALFVGWCTARCTARCIDLFAA